LLKGRNEHEYFEFIRDGDPPASLRRRIHAFEDELRLRPIPNDHPHDIHQIFPVTIFHPILAEFKYDLANLSTFDPPSRHVERTVEFVVKSLEIYPEEGDRIGDTRPVLERLLGNRNWICIGDCPTTGKVFHDRDLALVAAVEWRNEFGPGPGEASVEVAEAYRKHFLQGSVCMRLPFSHSQTLNLSQLQRVRNSSCCPSLLFAIMGPYLRIQAAVFLDKVIHRGFTEYMWLGGNPYLDENIMRIARIFNAAAKAVRKLHAYYDNLELSDTPVPSRLFPRPTFGPEDQPDFQLTFTEKLCFESRVPRLLFGAEITEKGEANHVTKKVVVKFAEHYGEEAHQLLAAHLLAPRLHFCKRTLCGLWMIVMDRVEGQDAYTLFPGEPPDYVKKDVDRAIQLLHQHGFVHGEICMSNILVVKRPRSQQQVAVPTSTSTEAEVTEMDVDDLDSETPGAVLIDFDWTGKDGETNYPPLWYKQPVPGVDGGKDLNRFGVMKKEHDRFMFERLGHWRV
jgi:hypothetical protein